MRTPSAVQTPGKVQPPGRIAALGTDNEQTASPGYTYTYDNAGEMTSETQTSTGDVWTYGYDFRGRMVTAVEKTSGGTTLESVTYTYDALDNRIGMDENGTQTWTFYDPSGTPIMDFNSSGSLTMRYLWGPIGIIARQTSGGTVSWYLADQFGTVRDIINNSGSIIDHVDFSAFGTVLGETSPSSGDRFTGFAMLERDTTTGLNLSVYREENPGTGRWDSQDPLAFGGGTEILYEYVGNGPVNYSDSLGLQEPADGGPPVVVKPIETPTIQGHLNPDGSVTLDGNPPGWQPNYTFRPQLAPQPNRGPSGKPGTLPPGYPPPTPKGPPSDTFFVYDPTAEKWRPFKGKPPRPVKAWAPGTGGAPRPAKPNGPYRFPIGYYQTKLPGGSYTIDLPDGKPVNVNVPDCTFWIFYTPDGSLPGHTPGRLPGYINGKPSPPGDVKPIPPRLYRQQR